jgi:hypothetical protein
MMRKKLGRILCVVWITSSISRTDNSWQKKHGFDEKLNLVGGKT